MIRMIFATATVAVFAAVFRSFSANFAEREPVRFSDNVRYSDVKAVRFSVVRDRLRSCAIPGQPDGLTKSYFSRTSPDRFRRSRYPP